MGITTGDVIAGRYRLLEKLGDGGMGEVFMAEDQKLSRQVAVKTIRHELKDDSEVRKRIDRECRLHAALGVHPNIVALHDRLEDSENIFLIMEYVPGKTASCLMAGKKAEDKTLSLNEAVSIILQTLEALAYIHDNDIIHRDIKPSNIILKETASGYVAKLMDFGIAYQEQDDATLARLTSLSTGGPGTPAYMAPERIDAETFGEQGPATDLYSIGIILYEFLGGSPPFSGTMTEVFTAHLTRKPNFDAIADGLPPRLLEILAKALKKKQEERYRDARAFLLDLKGYAAQDDERTILHTGGVSTDKTVLATGKDKSSLTEAVVLAKKASVKKRRKSKIVLFAVILICMLLPIAAAVYWWNGRQPDQPQENNAATEQTTGQEAAVPDTAHPAPSDESAPETGPVQQAVEPGNDISPDPEALPAVQKPVAGEKQDSEPADPVPEPEPPGKGSGSSLPGQWKGFPLGEEGGESGGDAMASFKERRLEVNSLPKLPPKKPRLPPLSPKKPVVKPKSKSKPKPQPLSSQGGWKVLKHETRKID
ncbi:MAG: hypothetical protein CSA20_08055 [Deltaproteobacteria bacterium]|nr:MAG: hypothetical protein CSA20_08055 [Deltaproteobacteria bacterium]